MAVMLQQLRRSATQFAIRQTLSATALLPLALQRSSVRAAITNAVRIPTLRRRVAESMRAALDQDFPDETVELYFRHAAWFLSSALSTFHAGIMATSVPHDVKFDDTIGILDAAVAERRGVIVASPHWSGHELVAAMISRRHPMVMLVRQAPTVERMQRKLKWYRAIDAELVLRPNAASTIKDAVAYLNVLKSGKLLGITPDLLANPGEGVEVRIFGRLARLHAGAFSLAVIARAPIIRTSFRWESDTSVYCIFDRAPMNFDTAERDVAVRTALQDWCDWFEAKLRVAPENWLFWLDKRWSRFLRDAPHVTRAP